MDLGALFIAIVCFVIAYALFAWLAPAVPTPPLQVAVKIIALIVALVGIWYLIVFLASLLDAADDRHAGLLVPFGALTLRRLKL